MIGSPSVAGGSLLGSPSYWKEIAMKKAFAVGIGAVAAIVLLAAFGGRFYAAHRDPQQAYQMISKRVTTMLDDIKASDAQRAQVNALKDSMFQQGQELRKSHEQLHQALIAQWDGQNVDAAAAHAQVDQQIDELRTFAHKALDSGIQLHDLLTPEQRDQLKAEIQSHHHHFHGP
jgi:periplasmic protein CpxP/Spy